MNLDNLFENSKRFWLFFVFTAFLLGSVNSAAAQDDKANQPKLSAEEAKVAKKIEEAKTLDEKIKAAGDYIKKYPKSPIRNQVAEYIAGQIAQTNDTSVIVAKSENYFTIFNEPAEADRLLPNLVYSYITLKRHKDAFEAGERYISRNPEDVTVRLQLAVEGANLVRSGNKEYMPQSRTYGIRAIELIETDKRPADVEQAKWVEYRTRWLPQLHQSIGLMNYFSGDVKTAQTNFEKAVALDSADVNSWILLGSILNDEYQEMAKKYTVSEPGAERDALLKQANERLDKIIELYARVVALTDSDPNAKALNTQVRGDLESYYKYRHSNSTDGLQDLINKYKKR